MKKIFEMIVDITIDAVCIVANFIKNNLMNLANILNLLLPYFMLYVGQTVANGRGIIAVGGEIFIPLLFFIPIYYLKSAANKLGKGITIPVPNKRFTQVSDDGEVSIENSRIQELLLYVADLEDWLERKDML